MAENPLLPNAELRALHTLLKRAAASPKSQAAVSAAGTRVGAPGGSEALLAGTLLQLREGDLLVPQKEQLAAAIALLAEEDSNGKTTRANVQDFPDRSPRLLFATGLASALRRSRQNRFVLAFATAGLREPQWAEAVSWAQEDLLPLILVCADPSGSEAFREGPATEPDTLAWHSFQRTAGKLQLPVLSVDGQDPVAVYRVMQESALRARAGGGPAVLWAVLPIRKKKPGGRGEPPSSIERLEHYMRIRKIPFS